MGRVTSLRLASWLASGSGLALGSGFGWLAFRISVGFRFDSKSGLALAWFRLDLASGFHSLGF